MMFSWAPFIFKGFSLSRPRILQYLTVNLKAFAYCSESLRKRFRSLQNAPKMPPSGLPGPLWEPMRGLWSSKLSPKIPKRHLKCPKEVLSDPQKVAKGSPRNPKTSPKIPKGYPRGSQRVPRGPPRENLSVKVLQNFNNDGEASHQGHRRF